MARVIPFQRGVPEAEVDRRAGEALAEALSAERRHRETPCAVCGIPERELPKVCACGNEMHAECYWGRVASLDEWRAFSTWLNDPTKFDDAGYGEPVRCPACRAKDQV